MGTLDEDALCDRVDELLPQTQCGQCGYPACRPYASAVALGRAEINQCPPGGTETIERLARLLNRPVLPLNPANGVTRPPQLAVVDEASCIGCTKCIQACPVDAIIGAAKLMHTVLTDECTGCELCLPPCPVDCIVLIPLPQDSWTRERAQRARRRYQAREHRLRRVAIEQQRQSKTATTMEANPLRPATLDRQAKQQFIEQAIARAKAKRANRQQASGSKGDGQSNR